MEKINAEVFVTVANLGSFKSLEKEGVHQSYG